MYIEKQLVSFILTISCLTLFVQHSTPPVTTTSRHPPHTPTFQPSMLTTSPHGTHPQQPQTQPPRPQATQPHSTTPGQHGPPPPHTGIAPSQPTYSPFPAPSMGGYSPFGMPLYRPPLMVSPGGPPPHPQPLPHHSLPPRPQQVSLGVVTVLLSIMRQCLMY